MKKYYLLFVFIAVFCSCDKSEQFLEERYQRDKASCPSVITGDMTLDDVNYVRGEYYEEFYILNEDSFDRFEVVVSNKKEYEMVVNSRIESDRSKGIKPSEFEEACKKQKIKIVKHYKGSKSCLEYTEIYDPQTDSVTIK